jgi:hypothetical protein
MFTKLLPGSGHLLWLHNPFFQEACHIIINLEKFGGISILGTSTKLAILFNLYVVPSWTLLFYAM